MPRVIQVIEVETTRGTGETPADMCRIVRQYFTLDGEFLAENDPIPSGIRIQAEGVDEDR